MKKNNLTILGVTETGHTENNFRHICRTDKWIRYNKNINKKYNTHFTPSGGAGQGVRIIIDKNLNKHTHSIIYHKNTGIAIELAFRNRKTLKIINKYSPRKNKYNKEYKDLLEWLKKVKKRDAYIQLRY